MAEKKRLKSVLSTLSGSVGLHTRILSIAFAACLPILFVSSYFSQKERERALSDALDRASLMASSAAEHAAEILDQNRSLAISLAQAPEVRGTGETCRRFLVRQVELYPWLADVAVMQPNGERICSARPEWPSNLLAERSLVTTVAGRRARPSHLIVSGGAEGAKVVATAPLLEDGRAIAVLAAAVDLAAFAAILLPGAGTQNVVSWIVDRDGALIVRRPPLPGLVGEDLGDRPVVRAALGDPNGSAEVVDFAGTPRLFAFTPLTASGAIVGVGIDRASVVGPIDRAAFERFLLMAGIFATAVLTFLLGSHVLILSPLKSLAETAAALEKGDFTVRNRRAGVGAAGALARAFDSMAEAVADRENRLQLATADAKEAYSRAQQANQAKTEFLASMSHEIRTPLNGIVGYTELLLEGKLNKAQRRYAERIEAAASALLTIVDDILSFSKIEAGGVVLDPKPFSLPAMIDNTVSIVRNLADRKNLPIRIDVAPDLPAALVGDEARLRQVLLNLLNNAVKFTAEGEVRLSVRRTARSGEGECFHFSVSDTGIGIPGHKRQFLFRRFSQAHGTEYGGSGLGLVISKRLIELMGGVIGVDSEEGRGSTFWFDVPLPSSDLASLESTEDLPRQALRPARVLVVDDLQMNQEITSAMLRSAGHAVTTVGDGIRAVEAVKKRTYDLILMDIQMREMDGVTATKQIRQLPSPAADVPIIAMTANVLPQQVRSFKAAGMNGHLAKPFTRGKLLEAIEEQLSGAAADAVAPAISGASASTDFDQTIFQELRDLLGSDRLVGWEGRLRTQLEDFAHARVVSDADCYSLARAAHKLISQAGSFGFRGVAQRCKELEDAYASGSDCERPLRSLQAACEEAVRKLDELVEAGWLSRG